MRLQLDRKWFVPTGTVGYLTVDSSPPVFTLEEPIGDGSGEAPFAILQGTFEIRMMWSVRFKRNMPHLLDVPHRTAIEIHDGNSEVDTHGCILVGNVRLAVDRIGDSRNASDTLNAKLQAAQDVGDLIFITIA